MPRAATATGSYRPRSGLNAHRLRLRFRELMRAEILLTLDDSADVEQEIQALFAALAS